MRFLIVNADDFNLTKGVARAVFRAHDCGIVSSTSVMMNLPLSAELLRGLKQRPRFGVGIHLNVTLGNPALPRTRVQSLVSPAGHFRRSDFFRVKSFQPEEVKAEWTAQIHCFREQFGKWPDHLNTHHHLHDRRPFADLLAQLARRYDIPVRRSTVISQKKGRETVRTTDYFFGSLSPKRFWTERSLLSILRHLPEGTSELMCHPAFLDSELKRISSFTTGRNHERKLFSSASLRRTLAALKVQLIRFSELKLSCYNTRP